MSENTKLNIAIKTISPEQAMSLIEGHENYRTSADRRIKLYADAMKSGKWLLSTIIIDENGQLCDGKHRLEAVVKAGISVQFAVITGWPVNSIIAIDNNLVRSKAQIARAERGIKNATIIMSMIQFMEHPKFGVVMLNSDSIKLLDKHGELAQEVLNNAQSPFDRAIHLIGFARAIMAYPDKKSQIFDALHKLGNMDFQEPKMAGLKLYFQWAITRGFSRMAGSARHETYLRCCRAIQAYLDGQEIDKLYCPSVDPFE